MAVCFDSDTFIYVWVDTSGTVNEPAIQAAIDDLKTQLQTEVYGEVDVDTRVFYDSAWTDERWVTKLTAAATAASKVIALVFINESGTIYHANSGTSVEPTAAYLTDHAAFLTAVAGATDFHGLVYAVYIDSPGYPIFKSHITNALAGTNGYPTALTPYNVDARLDVNPEQDSSAYYNDIVTYLEALCITGGSGDRIRSNISIDAGSVLRATRLQAVEADISIDFLEDTTLDQTTLLQFTEAVDPGVVALTFYPSGVQNTERLNAYAGETILGRMALTYPSRIMGTVTALSSGTDTSWSLAEALTYLFQQWASEHTWFRYETVPDLRTARDDGDYADGKGTPYTSVIGIPQSERNRRTMREIVDEFLSAVPGAVLTVSSSGELRIVPRDGPDADTTPSKTLDGDDAYQVSTGYPDQRASVNGAIVTNRGWSLEESVSVMQPSWFMLRQAGTPSDKYLTPPTNVLDLTTSTLLGATGAPGVWPVADDDTVLDTGAVLTWTDPDTTDLLITGHVRYYNYPSGPVDETNDTTHSELNFENVTDLPLDGDWHEVFTLRRTFAGGSYSYFVTLEAMFNGSGIEFRVSDSKLSGPFVHALTWWASGQAVFGITLDALGNRWGNSVTKTARFTYSNGNTLVDTSGGNALATSVTAYGERVDTISIGVFDLDVDTLERIAIAHVLRNIEPKTTRTVEQSAWRAFPIKNDDIGRLVQLPSSERGIVVNRRYSDEFGIDYSDGSLSSSFDAEIVAAGDEVLGDTTGYLHLDSGELWVMNDGNPSEVN